MDTVKAMDSLRDDVRRRWIRWFRELFLAIWDTAFLLC